MANLSKGNYIALQALRPVELKIGDFIDTTINNYIKDGRAAEAAKLKRMQDEGKVIMDMYKEVKIDPLKTIPMWQEEANKVYMATINNLGEQGRIVSDLNVPKEQRYKALGDAKKLAANMVALNNLIGSEEFINGYKKRIETDPSTIWTGDKGTQLISGIAQGNFKIAVDEGNMVPLVSIPSQDSNEVKPQWTDATEAIMTLMQTPELDRSKDLDVLAKQQAVGAYEKVKSNTTGNVTTESNKFLPEEARKSFKINFGDFDINNKDVNLKQFAYQVLNGRSISSKEDYDKVEQAWVDKIEGYVPKESSYIVQKSAQELELERLKILQAKKSLRDNPPSSSATPQSKVSIIAPDISRGLNNEITQINQKGLGRNVQNATLINLNEKEYVAGYKVKNSNGKGFHTEYAILGRDEKGRFNYNEITKRGDVNIRLAGYGIDPIAVEKIILSGPEAKQGKWANTSSMNLKSFNQARPTKEDTTEKNPFDTAKKDVRGK